MSSWHEDMARRGIDSDTSLDLDDNQSNHQGEIIIFTVGNNIRYAIFITE